MLACGHAVTLTTFLFPHYFLSYPKGETSKGVWTQSSVCVCMCFVSNWALLSWLISFGIKRDSRISEVWCLKAPLTARITTFSYASVQLLLTFLPINGELVELNKWIISLKMGQLLYFVCFHHACFKLRLMQTACCAVAVLLWVVQVAQDLQLGKSLSLSPRSCVNGPPPQGSRAAVWAGRWVSGKL